jgi:hypothetical protein
LFFGGTFTSKVLQPVVNESAGEVTVAAIHDDAYLFGKIEAIIKALTRLEELARGIGLSFNRLKCEVLRNAQNASIDARLGMPGTSDGIVALGAPIGTPAFVKSKALEMFSKHGDMLECITDLPPGMAIPLLAGSYNGKPVHLLRAIEPELVREPAVAWDNKMDTAIAKVCMARMCEGGYDEFAGQVRGLTTSRGGLGIKRLHGTSSRMMHTWRAVGEHGRT